MANVREGGSEVIFLSAVDFVTGAVLLNHYVSPTRKIANWGTRIHGITRGDVESATARGEALRGWKGARDAVWKLIDENTILVGHALQNDLDILRMLHSRVVDSAVLAREAVGENRQWGLALLCHELLKIDFRDNKRKIHNCLEDVLATRDVVLYCIRHQDELRVWADLKRLEEQRKKEARDRIKEEKKAAKERAEIQNLVELESPLLHGS